VRVTLQAASVTCRFWPLLRLPTTPGIDPLRTLTSVGLRGIAMASSALSVEQTLVFCSLITYARTSGSGCRRISNR
jgi:hypothetical protein